MIEFNSPKSKDPLYRKLASNWKGMQARCYNKDHDNYKYYGGKGITISWGSFKEFLEDVDKIPGWNPELFLNKKLHLDKDLRGGGKYSLETCSWVSRSENIAYGSKTRVYRKFYGLSDKGVLYEGANIAEFARKHNLEPQSVGKCLNNERPHTKYWVFWYEGEPEKEPQPLYAVVDTNGNTMYFRKPSELKEVLPMSVGTIRKLAHYCGTSELGYDFFVVVDGELTKGAKKLYTNRINIKDYKVYNPEGQLVDANSLRELMQYGLKEYKIRGCLHSGSNTVDGWTFVEK